MGPEGAILNMPHSKGGLDTLRALEGLPKSIRNQLQVEAFAPAAIIPNYLAGSVTNYASIGLDPVVLRDHFGVTRGLLEGNLKFLPLGQGAPLIGNHSFDSSTFANKQDQIIRDFTKDRNCNFSWKN